MKFGRHEKAQVKLVEEWNRDFEIGTEVLVTKDDGSKISSKTRSEAYMLGACRDYPGHTAVILLERINGCYMLERVRFEVKQ